MEPIFDINTELHALALLEGKDLDQSSSLMSLFIPHNNSNESNVPRNNNTNQYSSSVKKAKDKLEETTGLKIMDTKTAANLSLSFGDLFGHLFEK